MSDAASSRYTSVAIALHWAMAALLAFMIWLGWNMDDNEARYQLHKSIGITVLFLALARLAWRYANPPPPLPDNMAKIEKTASHAVHVAFYVLMIGIPIMGWLLVSVSPFQVSTVLYGMVSWPHLPFPDSWKSKDLFEVVETIHGKGAWLVIGLLGLHVAGAVKHEIGAEDGVLKRMLPGLFGKAAAPALPARGAVFAFGGSLLLFAAIAAIPLLPLGSGNAAPAGAPAAATSDVNWTVDYDSSEIAFEGLYEGKPFDGEFESWTAEVAFYPDDLARSHVSVIIDARSAKTGKKLYDDSLKGAEWFDMAAFPQATVELTDFKTAPGGYEATATLSVKDGSVSIPLAFSLEIEGDRAKLEGTAELSRKALNLGQKSDASNSWIADKVVVTVSGRADRKA